METLSRNGSEAAITTVKRGYDHTTMYKTALVSLSVLIALSNATILLLYNNNARLRTTKNLLLASLALSDLCAGTVVLPITLSCFQDGEWNICITSAVFFRFLAYSTMLHILAIIFEKYISILHPFCVVQKNNLRVVSACIWITSFVVSALPLAWLSEGTLVTPNIVRKELIYFVVTFIAFFIVPFVVIVFAQIRMIIIISRSFTPIIESVPPSPQTPVECAIPTPPRSEELASQRDSIKARRALPLSSSQNRKVLTAFALMLGTFTICWMTWYVGIILSYVDKDNFLKFTRSLKQTFQILVFLPSLMNPLLYTYYKQDFRHALKVLLKTWLKALFH